MKTMEFVYADLLLPDQLMINDFINFNGDIVEVLGIESDANGDNYFIAYQDEYGDKDIADFKHTDKIELYVFVQKNV
jgi:hypothetical protein